MVDNWCWLTIKIANAHTHNTRQTCICQYLLINEIICSNEKCNIAWLQLHRGILDIMMTSSALLATCAGNSPVTGEVLTRRPVTRSFDVFFDLRLNKRLSKQSWGWSIETLSRSLPSHCTDILIRIYIHIYYTSTISFHDNSETWTNHHGCTGRLCIDGWVQNFSISNALAMEILHHDKQRITPSLTTSYTIYDTLTNGYFKWHSMTLRWRTWLRYNEMDLRSCRLTKITQAPRADVGQELQKIKQEWEHVINWCHINSMT